MSIGTSSTPLGQVRGTGSAQHGGEHWLRERLTSAASLFLGLWLILSLLMLPSLDRLTLTEWLRQPSGAVPMALFIVTAFAHALDGMKVVTDDYVHDEGNRVGLHYLMAMAAIAGAALSLFALARIAFAAA